VRDFVRSAARKGGRIMEFLLLFLFGIFGVVAAGASGAPMILFRKYQEHVFWDDSTGILVLHWSRQIGKSFTLAAWAVYRLLQRPGRLVTVLSNSRDNGAEFVAKCREVTEKLGAACEVVDQSPDLEYENMRFEVRIKVKGKEGRIKVLAANPRTARGFSGDLILDEFAFHENSNAIWEAAEPILSSNPDFVCRIASTGNGKHNMFYRMVSGAVPIPGKPTMYKTEAGFVLSRVSRTEAWKMGVKIYDQNTRKPITPDQARSKALDKRAYDQNYECKFNDENTVLLTHELIAAAEDEKAGVICEQDWSPAALALLRNASGPLFVGVDVGRFRDLTVITVLEKIGSMKFVRAILRIQGMRLPSQQRLLGEAIRMKKFKKASMDLTGLGLGLFEYAQDEFGASRIHGINFASTVPTTNRIKLEGRKQETVRVTEALATELLQAHEDRTLRYPIDTELREDLRKPEKIVSPGGRVSIAATRDEAGHADHFWSMALAVEAALSSGDFQFEPAKQSRSEGAAQMREVRGKVWL
jgi:phage FluMu gp28-like protein